MNRQRPNSSLRRIPLHRVNRRGGFWPSGVAVWTVFFGASASWRAFSQTTDKLPPLAPPYGAMPPTFWEQHGTALLMGGISFLLLAGALIWKGLPPKRGVVPPPEAEARDALQKLADQPEDGRLLSRTSQILRRYVVAGFGLPSAEMTTTEFCRTLRANENVGGELAEAIACFARECDERKFSPSAPPAAMNAVSRALELVSRGEARRAELRSWTDASK
jgi:hypothetical protein